MNLKLTVMTRLCVLGTTAPSLYEGAEEAQVPVSVYHPASQLPMATLYNSHSSVRILEPGMWRTPII